MVGEDHGPTVSIGNEAPSAPVQLLFTDSGGFWQVRMADGLLIAECLWFDLDSRTPAKSILQRALRKRLLERMLTMFFKDPEFLSMTDRMRTSCTAEFFTFEKKADEWIIGNFPPIARPKWIRINVVFQP